MKIRKLRLKGVRCFDDFEIDLTHPYTGETLNRVVLVGVNGSGKTTILEAIFFLFEVLPNPRTLLPRQRFPDFAAHIGEVEGEIKFNAQIQPILIRRDTSSGEVEREDGGVPPIGEPPYLGGVLYFPSLRQLPMVDLKMLAEEKVAPQFAYRYSDAVGPDGRGSLHSYIVYQNYLDLLELERNGAKGPRFGRIKALFDKVFIGKRLAGVEGLDVMVETDDGGRHDINQLSHGEKQMFLLLADLLRHEPKHSIILIDEPELSLHPQWQDQLIYLVEQIGEDNQIIVATHSTNIATSVFPEEVLWLSTETAVAAEKAG